MNLDQETGNSAPVDRQRLPNRRGNVSFGFKYEGFTYRATAGHFDDGRLAEIFLDVPGKLGTPLQSNADTTAILASLLLQHGVAPEVISHSIAGPISIALAEFSKAFEQGEQGEHST
jgi:hypothetical protein